MYDLIIIGGGVSGLAASIYAHRFNLKTLVLAEGLGGTITLTGSVENYPGLNKVSGQALAEHFIDHAKSLGVEIKLETVLDVEKQGLNFVVKTSGLTYETSALIYATGTTHRKLEAKGALEFENRGVSYCATCDGPFYRGKKVAVVGGSDSAAKEALLLTQFAEKVYIVYRRDEIRAEPITKEYVNKNEKIEIITNAEVEEIFGHDFVEKIKLKDGRELEVNGVFVEIGRIPNSKLAQKLGVNLNEKGEIVIDNYSKTNVEGVYAAGDITNEDWKQVITGVAQGVKAAYSAYQRSLKLQE